VLQCVAVCCSVLQCVATSEFIETRDACVLAMEYVAGVLQCVAVCCSVLQCVVVCCSALQCGAVCCSALQCVTV